MSVAMDNLLAKCVGVTQVLFTVVSDILCPCGWIVTLVKAYFPSAQVDRKHIRTSFFRLLFCFIIQTDARIITIMP